MAERYYLFTGQKHDRIRLDYTHKQIDKLIEMWEEGVTYEKICRKLRISEYEMALIVMDLSYCDRIQERDGGFWGVG